MKKILIAEFKHETSSFASGLTDENSFRQRNYLFGEDVLRQFDGVKNETGGFLHYFSGKEEYELIPAIAFNAQPGAIVAQDVFETAKNSLLKVIEEETVDGILLALHGAMVTEKYQDGEGELLQAIRQAVKPETPVMATLDLHVNLTEKMVNNATAFFPFDYYPHTDMFDAGIRAASCMDKTLSGQIVPTMAFRQLDILLPYMPTSEPVMAAFVEKAQELRDTGKIINVNICHGFFSSDIHDQGMSVIAVTDEDILLAQKIADDLADELWNKRSMLRRSFYTIDEAIDEALSSQDSPFVFADVADNPGAGGSCDGTHMLKRLLERNVQDVAFASIYDPETVALAVKAGVGNTFQAKIGGKICPDLAGEPIICEAYVKSLTDGKFINRDFNAGLLSSTGTTAVLIVKGIKILVTEVRAQPWDLECFRANGIMPEDEKILVAKSTIHYRTSYNKVACKSLDVELPGLAPQSPQMLTYKHVRRPIYPLDEI